LSKNYIIFISENRTPLFEQKGSRAVALSRDKMKRRAFRLRSLIDNVKNKKARQEVIAEYVSLISQMSRNN
jgi:hypothetical protein